MSDERLLEPVGSGRLRRAAIGEVDAPGSARAGAAREGRDAVFAVAARARLDREAAPRQPRYDLDRPGHHFRQGCWDRAAGLLGSVRPRHLPRVGQALRRCRRDA